MSRTDTQGGGKGLRQRRLDRSRNTFWALLLLDVLIGLEALAEVSGGRGLGEVLGTLRAPVLVWALAVTAYAFCAWRRPAEQPQPAAETTAEATTDPRTGLFTMEHLKSCLECERQRAEEEGVSAAIVYLDLVNLVGEPLIGRSAVLLQRVAPTSRPSTLSFSVAAKTCATAGLPGRAK